jgi:nuclear transport factor 2 (NTF2) superfamily protein
LQKVQAAEDAWNSRDPQRVAAAYTPGSTWRNPSEFLTGRGQIVEFLASKWRHEHDFALRKSLWAYDLNRMAVCFQYEWRDDVERCGGEVMAMRTGSSMRPGTCLAAWPVSTTLRLQRMSAGSLGCGGVLERARHLPLR